MFSIFRFRSAKNRRRRTLGRKSEPGVPLRQRTLPRAMVSAGSVVSRQASQATMPVRKASLWIRSTATSAIRAIMSPFESLVTVTVEDHALRIVVSRGYRVSGWWETELPNGVVRDGQIISHDKFEETLFETLEAARHSFRFGDRRVAVAISGRNHVHRRFSLFVPRKVSLARAVTETFRSDLQILGDDMLFDWEAEGSRSVEGDERSLIAHEMGSDEARVPSGAIYTVYGTGLRRHVVENNLEPLSLISKRMAGVQPKTLALGAAANELSAIIVDIESRSFSVIVLKNGLPEVVRESSFDADEDQEVLTVAIKGQIGRAVAYLNSHDVNDDVDDDTPLFLTGAGAANPRLVALLGRELPFPFKKLPKTLRAPEEFPFNRFASNVGLALVSGKRFWQLTRIPIVNHAQFDLRPVQYKPKPLPVKAALKAATAAVFAIGLVSAALYTNERLEGLETTRLAIETLESHKAALDARNGELKAIERETQQIEDSAEGFRSVTESLAAIDRGHSDLVAEIFLAAPEGVSISRYDDTGARVTFTVSGVDYEQTLLFVDSLAESPLISRLLVDRVVLPVQSGPGSEGQLVEVIVQADRAASAAQTAQS